MCLLLFTSYHAGLEKWVEIGNSGMFRPEMLQPMGLPEDVRVIAWGLSLERYNRKIKTFIDMFFLYPRKFADILFWFCFIKQTNNDLIQM